MCRSSRRLMALLLLASMTLSACQPLVSDSDQTLSIYATFFPIYALTDALTRDIPDLTLHCIAQPQDGCLRSYELSDWDTYLLASSADAVVMGGRGLESFESALFGWGESGPAVSAVLYNMELYNQGKTHAREGEESHLEGANPHLYMSVDGAGQIVEAIGAMLMTLDPRYSQAYAANEAAALEALSALSAQTRDIAGDIAGERCALMNEALIYVANDYGLEVAEWIDRESGVMLYDTELEECLDALSRSDARIVLIERQAPDGLVDALEAAGYALAKIDIMSTRRGSEGFDGYVQAQLNNARSIARAFEKARISEDRS